MDVGDLTPALVLTLGGASIVVSIITQVILSTWRPSPEAKDRFGPLLALVVGIGVVLLFGALQGATDYAALLLTGLLAGGGGMGIHDTVDAVTPSS